MSTTWILVSNASSGKIFKNTGPNKGLEIVKEFEHPQSREKNSNLVSDRPGYLSRSCYIGYVLTVIERDGNVWGCLPESSCGEPLGNIHEKMFREIWYGRPYENFRRKQLLLDKSALDHEGCHSYCQHLETNIRLNRFLLRKRKGLHPSAGGGE